MCVACVSRVCRVCVACVSHVCRVCVACVACVSCMSCVCSVCRVRKRNVDVVVATALVHASVIDICGPMATHADRGGVVIPFSNAAVRLWHDRQVVGVGAG